MRLFPPSAWFAAGPPDNDGTDPSERTGQLWDLYQKLQGDGWNLDAKNYTTNFRSGHTAQHGL